MLNIYLPNQWFYIASYFTDLYNELQKYKKAALSVVSKDRLKEMDGNVLTNAETARLNSLTINDTSKNYLVKFITDYSWWNGAKTIDRGDFFISPILNGAKLVNASQSFVADLCAFLSDKEDLVQAIINERESASQNGTNTNNSASEIPAPFRPYLTALRTKPFLLLAGISGTGKSRIVRELAMACWDFDDAERKAHKPRNFEMVQVKPNWHDSTELIGYVSREPSIPYFLCLDEMNLAPVEQYFAEFLSVLESRKLNDDLDNLPYTKDIDSAELDESQIITRSLDEITCMKILPRIEGDEEKTSKVLTELEKILKDHFDPQKSVSLKKIAEMKKRLGGGFTSFWSM